MIPRVLPTGIPSVFGYVNMPEIIAIASATLSAVVGVCVPGLTFRYALRQQQVGWLRAERAKLYADLLAEAQAEKDRLESDMAAPEDRERMGELYPDLRLSRGERAQLGARANALASREVMALYNTLERHVFELFVSGGPRHEGDRLVVRGKMTGTLDELREAIRSELESDAPMRTKERRTVFRRSR